MAALLPGAELFDDVDSVGDAVPVLSAADVDAVVEVAAAFADFSAALIGFFIMVTGCVTVVCGPFVMRRCTAALNDSVVMCRSLMWVINENRLRGKLSQRFGPGPHWQ